MRNENAKNGTYRQGDVYLKRIGKLPEGLERKDNVLVEGETSGHAHRLDEGAVVYKDSKGNQYVQVQKSAKLTHEEHSQIEIPKGAYRFYPQREYSPQESRRVMD